MKTTIREKIKNEIIYVREGNDLKSALDKIESLLDEEMIKFAEWVRAEVYLISNQKSTKELLTQYKQEEI